MGIRCSRAVRAGAHTGLEGLAPSARTWTGAAYISTERSRLTGEPSVAKAWSELSLGDDGGKLECDAIWLFNEPVREISFGWNEVERLQRVRWGCLYAGVRVTLRRRVLSTNTIRSFYFFTTLGFTPGGRRAGQLLSFAERLVGAPVEYRTDRFFLLHFPV